MNIPFNEKECNDQMNSISDNCDGNGPSSPRNYKGGETPTIGEKVIYYITPHQCPELPSQRTAWSLRTLG